MCGRDTFFATWAEVRAFSSPLPLATPAEDAVPAYNRAPTQQGWVIRTDGGRGGEVVPMRWGLVPFWAKDPKIAYSTINARIESAASKPAFREPWKRRRCLVPSSGYYEWQVLADGKTKQPWFIHAADAPILVFAGLWDHWRGPDGDIDSYAILTQAADGAVAAVHDRMPLSLPPTLLADWLHGSPDDAAAIAAAAPVADVAFHRVARAVGNARNQGPGLIAELAEG